MAAGTVMTVTFDLDGQGFTARDSRPSHERSPSNEEDRYGDIGESV